MKLTITALQITVEQTPYTDEGKVMPRPQPVQLVAYESEIPEIVLEWVRNRLPQGSG